MTADVFVLAKDAQDLLFREARTANAFTDEPVSDDQVEALYELIKWAPTSLNQQPLRVLLVRSPDAREKLASMMYHNNQEKVANAPLVAILAADTEFHEHLDTQYPSFPGVKNVFFAERPVREESAKLNTGLQIAYFIIGVRALGLAAGPMVGFDEERVNKEFFPDGDRLALVVVNIGKPAEQAWAARLPRLGYDQVFSTV